MDNRERLIYEMRIDQLAKIAQQAIAEREEPKDELYELEELVLECGIDICEDKETGEMYLESILEPDPKELLAIGARKRVSSIIERN